MAILVSRKMCYLPSRYLTYWYWNLLYIHIILPQNRFHIVNKTLKLSPFPWNTTIFKTTKTILVSDWEGYAYLCILFSCNRVSDRETLQYCLSIDLSLLYHIGVETKWPPFRGRHFHVHFLEWTHFERNFTEIYSLWSNWQYSNIGSDNGLAPNRQQVNIWRYIGMV